MTLAEFFSWQAYARARADQVARPAAPPLPALADLGPAAIGRALGGR